MIYTIKTVVGREKIVLDSISSKIKSLNLNVRALVHPEEIKGYVFVVVIVLVNNPPGVFCPHGTAYSLPRHHVICK